MTEMVSPSSLAVTLVLLLVLLPSMTCAVSAQVYSPNGTNPTVSMASSKVISTFVVCLGPLEPLSSFSSTSILRSDVTEQMRATYVSLAAHTYESRSKSIFILLAVMFCRSAREMVKSNLATVAVAVSVLEMENVEISPSVMTSLNSPHMSSCVVLTMVSAAQSKAMESASVADTETSSALRYSMMRSNSISYLVLVSVSVVLSPVPSSISFLYSTLTLRSSLSLEDTLNLISSLISTSSFSVLALHLNSTLSLFLSTSHSRLDGAFFFFSLSNLRPFFEVDGLRTPRGPLEAAAAVLSASRTMPASTRMRSFVMMEFIACVWCVVAELWWWL
mmetsp:Transcript_16203/g.44893  ORF Transcript_16203/g.44893 Transcript_16203/m.44893 type:complete len:333 (-) Transcript_16203:23-1021(-)